MMDKNNNSQKSGERKVSSFSCNICFNHDISSTKRFNNGGTCKNHSFCVDCIEKHIEAKLQVNSSAKIKCPDLGCRNLLDPLACRSFLSSKVFIRWCDVLCESTVNQYQRSYCPFKNCSTLIVNECGDDNVTSTNCVCPICKGLFCFNCGCPWHAGYSCNEARTTIVKRNDDLFFALMKKTKWRRCPGCQYCVERMLGCNIIECRCGIRFCYLCGKKVVNISCECTKIRREREDRIIAIIFIGIIIMFFVFFFMAIISSVNLVKGTPLR